MVKGMCNAFTDGLKLVADCSLFGLSPICLLPRTSIQTTYGARCQSTVSFPLGRMSSMSISEAHAHDLQSSAAKCLISAVNAHDL